MQFIINVKNTSLLSIDQASITIDTFVEKNSIQTISTLGFELLNTSYDL